MPFTAIVHVLLITFRENIYLQKLLCFRNKYSGQSQAKTGVLKSSVHGWLRDEEKMHNFIDMVDSAHPMKRKKAKTGKDTHGL